MRLRLKIVNFISQKLRFIYSKCVNKTSVITLVLTIIFFIKQQTNSLYERANSNSSFW